MQTNDWRRVVETDYAVPQGYTPIDLLPSLVLNLGSPDAALRDELTLPILATWLKRDYFTADEIHALIEKLMAQTQIGLGQRGTDTVFLRSFSVLLLAEIIHQDRVRQTLPDQDVHHMLQAVLTSITAERDVRGYVPGKGWAHAIAHTADALWVLATHRHTDKTDLERIMQGIAEVLASPAGDLYLYNEDERLVRAVMGVLQREMIELAWLADWFHRLALPKGHPLSIGALFAGDPPPVSNPDAMARFQNTRQFLRGLHFALTQAEGSFAIAASLLDVLVAVLQPLNEA